jgi:hypothetical protein
MGRRWPRLHESTPVASYGSYESLMQFPDDFAAGDALKAVGIRGVAGALGEMAARHPVFDLEMFDHRLDGGMPLERQQATVLVGDLGWPCPLLSAVPRMMSTIVHCGLSDAYGSSQPTADSTKRAIDGRAIREQRFRVRRR